ncbi:hypothetical protein Ndes2437B_g00129 [Nannochloris sp. 'desiccata']|nr:hypothetical protein KSW81_002460 [Chlorella desiccata (nom. nud.)]
MDSEFSMADSMPPSTGSSAILARWNSLHLSSADPELVRQAAITNFQHLQDRSMFQICPGMAIEAEFMNKGLFASQGKDWTHARAILQQFFTRDELIKHTHKMNFSADRLLAFLATSASAGDEFEATYTFSKMTMEVIGTTAFGVDFHLQHEDIANSKTPSPSLSSSSGSASINYGFNVLSAARSLFQPLGLRGNKARIVLGLAPLLGWVQRRGVAIGGRVKALKTISLARCFIWGILHGILENSYDVDSIERIGMANKNRAETTGTGTATGASQDKTQNPDDGQWPILSQCPMHTLGKIRGKSFNKGKQSLKNVAPESSALLKLFKGVVNPETDKPFTEFDICAQGFNIIVGAYETTALGLSFTLYELAKQPELQRRIAKEVATLRVFKKNKPSKRTRAAAAKDLEEASPSSLPLDISFEDLKYLPFTEACFLEGLRLWPPASSLIPMSRHAKEDVTLDGYKIPKGACVMFNVWHVHHNSEYYPSPEKYTPDRFLSDHPEMKIRERQAFLPFGAGPRKCIGKAFAIAEAVIALAKMLEQFEFRVDMARSAELDIISSATLQPVNGIWLKVFKREEESSC